MFKAPTLFCIDLSTYFPTLDLKNNCLCTRMQRSSYLLAAHGYEFETAAPDPIENYPERKLSRPCTVGRPPPMLPLDIVAPSSSSFAFLLAKVSLPAVRLNKALGSASPLRITCSEFLSCKFISS